MSGYPQKDGRLVREADGQLEYILISGMKKYQNALDDMYNEEGDITGSAVKIFDWALFAHAGFYRTTRLFSIRLASIGLHKWNHRLGDKDFGCILEEQNNWRKANLYR